MTKPPKKAKTPTCFSAFDVSATMPNCLFFVVCSVCMCACMFVCMCVCVCALCVYIYTCFHAHAFALRLCTWCACLRPVHRRKKPKVKKPSSKSLWVCHNPSALLYSAKLYSCLHAPLYPVALFVSSYSICLLATCKSAPQSVPFWLLRSIPAEQCLFMFCYQSCCCHVLFFLAVSVKPNQN